MPALIIQMLNTKQPKKSNSNIRYALGNNLPISNNIVGKAIKKNRPLKEKLQKNLSQFPIAPLNDSRQNASLAKLMIQRPQSSLVASDISGSPHKSPSKIDMNSFCKDKIKMKKISSKRNTLGVIDSQIKMRRQSGTSHSNIKWNNRSVEEDPNIMKYMMAQNRKKYNLSCGDAIQNKSVSKSKGKQNISKGYGKKKSLLMAAKKSSKAESKKNIKKQVVENEDKKYKQLNLGVKSRGSTSFVNQNAVKQKKKQRENKENKKKRSKSKSKSKLKPKKHHQKQNKMFLLSKQGSDDEKSFRDQEYPINKYFEVKHYKPKNLLNIKVGLDNMNHFNGSGSSAIYGEPSRQNQLSGDPFRHQKMGMLEEEGSASFNFEEIKYYEQNSPLRFRSSKKFKKLREEITNELQEQYPYLDSTELNFLSSVIFIQRKWRQFRLHKQLNIKRQTITEYIVQELQLSKISKKNKSKPIESEQSRLGQKVQGLSRTKVAQFDQSDIKNLVLSKNKEEELDPSEYETRKNSMKHQIIIYSLDESEQKQGGNNGSNEMQGDLTDRKPMTENIKVPVNYSWILSKQIFPEITYLQYRRNFIREEFEKTMTAINEQRLNRTISEKEFEIKKQQATKNYTQDLSSLKKAKHDIKKGYLKYIDCINKVKEINDEDRDSQANKHNNKYGLRKVSSQSNFLSTLYEKIFKFDKCLSEWSGGSQSIEMLTKKILIRKQHCKGERKSERRSLSDVRSAARSSYQMLRTSLQPESSGVVLRFQNTDRFANLLGSEKQGLDQNESRSKIIREFKFSNEIFEKEEQKPGIQSQRQKQAQSIEITSPKLIQNTNINTFANSISLKIEPESLVHRVEQEILIELGRELEKDIHKINPVLMDMILINQPSFSDYQEIEYEDEEEQVDYDDRSPAHQFLHKELEDLNSPRNLLSNRKIHLETEPEQIISYLNQLISFIHQQKWEADIIYNMNHAQTFSPLAYLKFLRDFQIPDDEFVPIINNQRFIEWESIYNQKMEEENELTSYNEPVQIFKQSQTIFHRCVFEVFLGELEKNRPYGQRGRPFPWQQKYSYTTMRQIPIQFLPQIFQKSIHKIQQYLMFKCGIISQKHFITNQQQLEKAHEENEDRIIQMLENDLMESSHIWYQMEQHKLEIKLEITYLLEEQLVEEITEILASFCN